MKRGKIIIISGPSGVGKGTVNKSLMLESDLKLVPSVSLTSRKPRPTEVDGVNYHFVSREDFERHIANNDFLEYTEFIGNYYGTLRKKVYEKIERGQNIILEIEVLGANKIIKNENPNDIVSIFLMPPSLKNLENRLRGRGTEAEDVIRKRLNKALLEIPLKRNYKYSINLDNIDNTIQKIRDILLLEDCLDNTKTFSQFYKIKSVISMIIKEKYMFFIENWAQNVKDLGNELPNNLNLFEYIVDLLSKRIYHFILENKDFSELRSNECINNYVEKFLLDINFHSVDQSNFINNED